MDSFFSFQHRWSDSPAEIVECLTKVLSFMLFCYVFAYVSPITEPESWQWTSAKDWQATVLALCHEGNSLKILSHYRLLIEIKQSSLQAEPPLDALLQG